MVSFLEGVGSREQGAMQPNKFDWKSFLMNLPPNVTLF